MCVSVGSVSFRPLADNIKNDIVGVDFGSKGDETFLLLYCHSASQWCCVCVCVNVFVCGQDMQNSQYLKVTPIHTAGGIYSKHSKAKRWRR